MSIDDKDTKGKTQDLGVGPQEYPRKEGQRDGERRDELQVVLVRLLVCSLSLVQDQEAEANHKAGRELRHRVGSAAAAGGESEGRPGERYRRGSLDKDQQTRQQQFLDQQHELPVPHIFLVPIVEKREHF